MEFRLHDLHDAIRLCHWGRLYITPDLKSQAERFKLFKYPEN